MSIDSISFWILRENHITGNFVLNLYNSIQPNTSIASKTFSVSEGEQSVTVVLNDPVELIEGDEYYFMIGPDTVLSEGNFYFGVGMGSNGNVNDSTYEGGRQLFKKSDGSLEFASVNRDLKFMITLSEPTEEVQLFILNSQSLKVNFTWQEAKADAESRGGRLAVLDTQEKIDLAYSLISSYFDPSFYSLWIGCSDHINEGDSRWIDGSVVESYEWAPGEPNDGIANGNTTGYQDYGAIKNSSTGEHLNYWDDVMEGNEFWYIFETLPE